MAALALSDVQLSILLAHLSTFTTAPTITESGAPAGRQCRDKRADPAAGGAGVAAADAPASFP